VLASAGVHHFPRQIPDASGKMSSLGRLVMHGTFAYRLIGMVLLMAMLLMVMLLMVMLLMDLLLMAMLLMG